VKYAVAGLVTLSVLVAIAAAHAADQTMQLGEVLVLEMVDNDSDAGAGNGLHLFKADRGSRKGRQVLVSTAGTMRQLPASAGQRRLVSPPGSERRFEYHLLSPDKVGALPAVDVLGIHDVKVRPERRDAFERFISQRVHPLVGNLRPDLRILYYKRVRGGEAGDYMALFALTTASRDKYWPRGADSDLLRAAFSPEVRAVAKELSTYLVEGSYAADPKLAAAVYESREWTDFVLVSPGR
jgi:hypothetical protein